MKFLQVGSYKPTSEEQLHINVGFRIDWDSDCDQDGACLECPNREHKATHLAEKPSPSDNNFVAFFDVHKPDPNDPTRCGEMDIGAGMQNFLAYYYAMNQFNDASGIPDESKVGGMAIDTCGNSIRVIQDVFSLQSGSDPCGASGDISPSSVKGYVVMGSENAVEANKLLAPSGIPTISPSATTTQLNGASYFLRTVPPDDVQAEAMAAILRQQGWYYVGLVNSNDFHGRGGRDAFMQAANESKVCVAESLSLEPSAEVASASTVLEQIGSKKGVSVIVLFTTTEHARLLLEAADDLNIRGKYIFLASERWADQQGLVQGVEEYAAGSISLKVQSAISEGFMDWVKSLTVANHGDIPDDWFEEFWQYALQCKLENATVVQSQFTRACAAGDRLTDANIEQNSYVLHTIISTQILASSLNDYKACQKENPDNLDFCDSLYERMLDAEWQAPPGELEGTISLSRLRF